MDIKADPRPTPTPKPSVTSQMLVIWTALFASLFIYAFVLIQKCGLPASMAVHNLLPDFSKPLEAALACMAAMTLFLSYWLPDFLLKGKGDSSDPNSRIIAFIIRIALIEASGLYGFVIAFIQTDMAKFLPYFILSSIGYLLARPKTGF